MKDKQEELDRLEQELLAEEPQPEEEIQSDEELLEEILEELSEAEETQEPSEAEAYSNYENDYDAQLQDFAETGEVEPEKKNDKLIIGLMITASVLCMGIIGILVYWLNAFLL